MDQIEIETTAIETNVRTLIKTHPSPKQFIETLRNEAIDQAFRETTIQLEATFQDIKKIYDRFEHVIQRIDDQNNRIFILEQTVAHNKKKE